MLKFKNILFESKSVGIIYHYTSKRNIDLILKENKLKASDEIYAGNLLHFISFTRNKNFHTKGSTFGVKTEYRITIDGNKLSSKYKIKPFAYNPSYQYTENWELDWLHDEDENTVKHFFNATREYDEFEERIWFSKPNQSISNIKNYIIAIDKVK